MKTTLEISDSTFRRAKAKAAERGIPLRQFVTEAVEEKLNAAKGGAEKPWMKYIGALKHLHEETERINQIIEQEFEQVDDEEWGDPLGGTVAEPER